MDLRGWLKDISQSLSPCVSSSNVSRSFSTLFSYSVVCSLPPAVLEGWEVEPFTCKFLVLSLPSGVTLACWRVVQVLCSSHFLPSNLLTAGGFVAVVSSMICKIYQGVLSLPFGGSIWILLTQQEGTWHVGWLKQTKTKWETKLGGPCSAERRPGLQMAWSAENREWHLTLWPQWGPQNQPLPQESHLSNLAWPVKLALSITAYINPEYFDKLIS